MAARYKVQHDYSAVRDGARVSYETGLVVEMDEADAEWVNRDSPGTLVAALTEPEPAADPEPDEPEPSESDAESAEGDEERDKQPDATRPRRPRRTRGA